MGLADLHQLAPVLAVEAEKSKTAFYVAGAVLAIWAVAVSVVGITRPEFPGTLMRTRVVSVVSAVLVLAAAGTAVVTASKPVKEAKAEGKSQGKSGGGEGAAGGALALKADEGGQLKFDKTSLSAKAGRVKIDFDNPAKQPHNVALELNGKEVAATDTVTASKASLTTTLKPGTYTFYCSVAGHRDLGMKGTLTVQ